MACVAEAQHLDIFTRDLLSNWEIYQMNTVYV